MDVARVFNGFGVVLILFSIFYFSSTLFESLTAEPKIIILVLSAIVFYLVGALLKGGDQ